MLHSHIHEHGHVRNGYIMFITIEHRNLRVRKHLMTSCSGTKPFYKLWVKGFDVRRRDTIFYAVLFIWPPTRAALIGRKFASRLWAPKVDPSRLASNSQLSNYFRFSQNLRALPVRDATCIPSPRFVLDHCDIWVTCPLCVHSRATTCIKVVSNQPMRRAERPPAQPNPKA